MKYLMTLLFWTTVFLLLAEGARAEKTGNGGGSWVCREIDSTIRWSLMVDLFEAENEFGLTLTPYPNTKSTQEIVGDLRVRLLRTSPVLESKIDPYLKRINFFEFNPPKVMHTSDVLKVIDDSLYHIEPSPETCLGGTLEYEQVVNFKNDGNILLQVDLWATFEEDRVRAAYVLHEAIYAYLRKEKKETNSVKSRRIVGLIMSTISDEELRKSLKELGEN